MFEIGSLRKVIEMGTKLRTIFLVGSSNKTTDALLDTYASLGVYGMGLSKNLLAKRDQGNYIVNFNTELVDKVKYTMKLLIY